MKDAGYIIAGNSKIHCDVFDIADVGPLAEIRALWDELASLQPQFVPNFEDLLEASGAPSTRIRLIGVKEGNRIVALAAFLISATKREFWIGERPVFRMRVRAANLFGSASLGRTDRQTATAILDRIANDTGVDLVHLRDVPQSDFLYKAVKEGHWGGVARISHNRSTRRLAILPTSMDAYWSSLRPSTRKAGLRDLKMFGRLNPTYSVHTTTDEVSDFVSRAADISAGTYQIKLGVGLVDTPTLRAYLCRMASQERIRCYIASVNGADVAFLWGDISHGVMYYRTTGFDPEMARFSPGKALVLHAIQDLIQTGAAHTFDFSGRDMDFKERFSNTSIECADIVLARRRNPRGLMAVAMEKLFVLPRRLARRILGPEKTRKLQKFIRNIHG